MMIYVAYVYGLLTLAGGIMGFVKAQSVPSLISGGLSGVLILLCAWLAMKGKLPAYYGLIGLSGLLAVFFAYRYAKGGAMMPAGMMLLLSTAAMLAFAFGRADFPKPTP